MERTSAAAPVPAQPFQFTIRSLLWFTLSVAMVLAFVRPTSGRLLPIALGAGCCGVALGTVLGWTSRRIGEAVYWSVLAMSLAVIFLAGQWYLTTAQSLGWPLVGVVAGAIAGAIPPGRLRQKLAACTLAGTLPMLVLVSLRPVLEHWGDVVLAALVSGLLASLSELFAWARTRYRTSYGAWAAALVLAVILGNWGAQWLAPILNDLLESR
jgi:ABC-type enterochelin transport system permease subunit